LPHYPLDVKSAPKLRDGLSLRSGGASSGLKRAVSAILTSTATTTSSSKWTHTTWFVAP